MIDLVVLQPTFVDFPLWREWLKEHRSLFNRVVVGLDLSLGRPDYTTFLINKYKDVDAIVVPDQVNQSGDWRDRIIKKCLDECNGEFILFLEQDFLIKNEELLETVFSFKDKIICFNEGDRIHPGFIFISKEQLNKIEQLDFSISPGYDHFYKITSQFKRSDILFLTEDLGYRCPEDWEHLAGTCYNYGLYNDKHSTKDVVIFNRERFMKYNQEILDKKLETHRIFQNVIERAAKGE